MDTAAATFRADMKAAFTPKLGEVRPIDIISLEPRDTKEDTVADLVEDLARDRRFLHPIAVRDEGEGRYLLISGHQRLEAWKRHFGKRQPIQAVIFPSDMPDARITLLDTGEDLHRKELTAAERTAQEMRWVAASKELNGEKPVTPVSETGEAAESGNLIPILPQARRGRGHNGMAQQVADKFGIRKRTVNMRRNSAEAVIGEEIDFDRDPPEELKRKAAELEEADKRQRAERKVVRLKRRKSAPRGVVEDPTQTAKQQAAEIGRKIEELWKDLDVIGSIDAIARKEQHRLIDKFCLGLGLDPPKMVRPAGSGLVEEESGLDVGLPANVAPTADDAPGAHAEQQDDAAGVGTDDLQHPGDAVSQAADQEPELDVGLPAEVALATDAVAEQAEHGDHVAVAHAEEHDEAAAVQANQGDNGAEFGAEDLEVAGDVPEAADPVIGAKERCAHCNKPFLSSHLPRKKFGRFWHRGSCENHAKPIAIAA